MVILRRIVSYGILSALGVLTMLMLYGSILYDPNWQVVEEAVASTQHPLAGFWKQDDCDEPWGWAIGPVDPDNYFVSFCAPGGCQGKADQGARITSITADPDYLVVDHNSMKFRSEGNWIRLVRCPARN